MLKSGVIEPTQPKWANQALLVPNPDNVLRFCIDYRHLYVVTVKETQPFPRMG